MRVEFQKAYIQEFARRKEMVVLMTLFLLKMLIVLFQNGPANAKN
ncbi:hypothetical protein ACFFF5_10190 [Lederbergia wuyishanensis]|uniref:Membrane protein n=1 Tax=Lederbergia wuyishanensis TaxID=1347903 RepID=A0ABU0D718_9BACI|nr:hypothetical protein [Lederbergia wuyishanensis]MDQ0344199.1 putative membrane protein [Lederbergia wuyishanensis]